MKPFLYNFSCLVYLLFFSYLACAQNAENINNKNFITPKKIGDCYLNSIFYRVESGRAKSIYEIDVRKSGNYYLGIVISPQREKEIIVPVDLSIDGKIIGRFNDRQLNQEGFQLINSASSLENKIIYLEIGKYLLTFEQESNFFPLIDQIQLSIESKDLEKLQSPVNAYINSLKQKKLPVNYLENKRKPNGGRILNNPQGDYQHEVDIDFDYTSYWYLYLTAGTTLTLHTQNSNCDPILYLFNTYPNLGSWANDDSNGSLESTITVTIPVDGLYILLVRGYQSTTGLTSIYRDGSLLYSNCPVAGKGFGSYGSNSYSHYFTCKLRGSAPDSPDTQVFVANSANDPIVAQNDDYWQNGGGDFDWGRSSRINGYFNQNINYTIVCAYSMSSYGKCDVFMNCKDVTTSLTGFNLKSEDAIRTGDQNENYNCMGWVSGKVTDSPSFHQFVYNPGEDMPPYSDYASSQLGTWDNFFANYPIARYAGAWTYTRDDNDQNNAVIALWGTNNGSNNTYTHVSIRSLNGIHPNSQPHGYDWESKNNPDQRFMHPKFGFQGTTFGTILNYYKVAPSGQGARLNVNSAISLQESLDLGLSEIEVLELGDDEKWQLKESLKGIPVHDISSFEELYSQMKKAKDLKKNSIVTWGYETTLEEYKRLLDWSVKSKKYALPLLIEKFINGDVQARLLIYDLTTDVKKEIMHQISDEIIANHTTNSGKYLVTTPASITYRYLKKIYTKNLFNLAEANLTAYPNPIKNNFTLELYSPEDDVIDIYIYLMFLL